MFGSKKPATTRPATPAWNPVNAVPAPAGYKLPSVSRYMTEPSDMSSVGPMLPATKHPAFAPPAQLRELGLHELADAIDAHAVARRDLAQATAAYDQAQPPRGATWQAAVAQTHDAVRAGVDDPGAAVRQILDGRSERIAAAVTAAWRCVDAFDKVLDAATRADPSAAEAALDQWTDAAVDAVRSLDRGRLVQLEEDLVGAGRYSQLRSVWQWLHGNGRTPYQPLRSAMPQPVAEAIIENHEQIGQLMGDRGIYSTTVLSQVMPGGSVTW